MGEIKIIFCISFIEANAFDFYFFRYLDSYLQSKTFISPRNYIQVNVCIIKVFPILFKDCVI